jgi:Na+/H+-dicarboxylate symporter
MITTFIAVGLAMGAALIFQPGVGLNIIGAEGVTGKENTAPGLATVILNLVPQNPFNAIVQGQLLPILFFAISFGISLSLVRSSADEEVRKAADTVYYFCIGAAEATYKIVWGVMQYAPIGVFFLISALFGVQGPEVVGSMMYVIALTFGVIIFHFVVVYGGILRLAGLNPLVALKGAREAMVTAFVTRSSNATLPVTIRCMKNLGVKPEVVSFSAPFGATVNMDGAAIYLGITTMFIANAVGTPLTINQMLMVALLATLGAIGTAGVPSAGVIMLLMVLEGIGMKVEAGSAVAAAYALMFAIDAVLDMGRTFLNVSGDMAVTPYVAKQEGALDMSKWENVKT